MTKKIYHISGFDCPNCAAKSEAHLNKQKEISYARIDFSANRLYITYKNSAYNVDKLKSVIAEVEEEPLDIYENGGEISANAKIIDKSSLILLIRIAIAIIITILNIFILKEDNQMILRLVLYAIAVIIIIYDITWKLILHVVHFKGIIDHNLLINISAIGAFTLGIIELCNGEEIHKMGPFPMEEYMEAVMVVTLFQIGRIIEGIATNKSKAAVMSAVSIRVDTANKITDNGVIKIQPNELNIDDIIIVTTGELIPIDGVVIEGEAYIDTSSLTGEYVPILANIDCKVYGGCLVKNGTIKMRVLKKYSDSTISKILDLIAQGGEKKSKADEFIAKFARIYTPLVIIVAMLVILIGGIISKNWMDYIYRGLEVLVTGCPCAIVISVPLAYFAAIGLASKNGIVVKGASYLDELVNMGKLITDKTGTLTHGSFQIQSIKPNNISANQLMEYIYASECLSTHPIAKAICHGKNLKKISSEQENYAEIPGKGIKTDYKGHHIITGNDKFLRENNIDFIFAPEIGTILYCAVDGVFAGYIVLADEVKEDAQPMVDLLHSEDIEIILLTGDHEENAKEICTKLGIDRWHSELLPEQKTDILIQEMNATKKTTAFIGDGINDAPSIIRSDIGIAMGGIGSDIAVENADLVIMNDDPAKVYDALKIAKIARNTSIFNIIFAIVVKITVAVLDIIPTLTLPMIVSVLADTGLTVLLVLNSLLILYRKVKRKRI